MELLPAMVKLVARQREQVPADPGATQQFCAAALEGGTRGFGSEPSRHVLTVFKLIFSCLASHNGQARHVLGAPLPAASVLAVRHAAERTCLWFRAHQVTNAQRLADYFDTAYAYFREYWDEKDDEALQQELAECPLYTASVRERAHPSSSSTATAAAPAPTTNSSSKAPPERERRTAQPPAPSPGEAATARKRSAAARARSAVAPSNNNSSSSSSSSKQSDGDQRPPRQPAALRPAPKNAAAPAKATTPAAASSTGTRRGSRSKKGGAMARLRAAPVRLDVSRLTGGASQHGPKQQERGAQIQVTHTRAAAAGAAGAGDRRGGPSPDGWVTIARGPAFGAAATLRETPAPASPTRLMSLEDLERARDALNTRGGRNEAGAGGSGPPAPGRAASQQLQLLIPAFDDTEDSAWWQQRYREPEVDEGLSEESDSEHEPIPEEAGFQPTEEPRPSGRLGGRSRRGEDGSEDSDDDVDDEDSGDDASTASDGEGSSEAESDASDDDD